MSKIIFDVSIGSHWPTENEKLAIGLREDSPSLPVGGEIESVEIDFAGDKLDDAFLELSRYMAGKPYHIWYWTWVRNTNS